MRGKRRTATRSLCVAPKRNNRRKMSCAASLGAHVFVTTYLLFVVGCVAQKVYFDCGAKVDVVDVQGLILSPGFPYNYSSGTHCVWQFFVPVDYQLILEIFDFDVFESHDSDTQESAILNFEEEESDEEVTMTPVRLAADEASSAAIDPRLQSVGDVTKTQQSSLVGGEVKHVVVQEQSTKMEIAKVSNSAKRSADASSGLSSPPSLLLPGPVPPGDKAANSISSSQLRGDVSPSSDPSSVVEETTPTLAHFTDTPGVSPETQHSVLDACPHDVLYISDLITFSSRFCGSNRPPSSQLVFGSSQEMVEVIMELITTTHWGRGFALLFHYHNLTEPGENRSVSAPTASKVDSLLAAVSGAAFFAMILTSVLCIIFRPKLCPKRASSCASSDSEEPGGVQNTGTVVSELQLMAENQTNLQATEDQHNNNSPQHTVIAGGDTSQNAEVDLSCSGLTELDLGADEVFIVSSAPSPSRLPPSAHTQRERFLRNSDTGPSPAGDWPSPSDSNSSLCGTRSTKDGSGTRPRAWSVRTFQDFLPPLPQLHKKWCSWNSTSPFTKLVDSAPSSLAADCRADNGRKVFSEVNLGTKADDSILSDSTISNASYPLTQPAQRQRRLNSTSNLRRSRFTGPCFGFLSATADPIRASGAPRGEGPPPEASPGSSSSTQCHFESGHVGRRSELPGEGDHISVPVFAISEEEDRQPLVPSEHLDQTSVLNGLAGGSFEGKKPAGGASLSPQSQRARPEWRPWGSQVSGGVGLFTPNDSQPSLVQSTVLCSVTNQM